MSNTTRHPYKTWGVKITHADHCKDVAKKIKYHSSWDWQIPVWAKVMFANKQMISGFREDKLHFTIIRQKHDYYISLLDQYEEAVFNNDPQAAFSVLLEAIEFYNQNKSD